MTSRLAAAIARIEATDRPLAWTDGADEFQARRREQAAALADLRSALDERVRELPAFAEREGWEIAVWLLARLA